MDVQTEVSRLFDEIFTSTIIVLPEDYYVVT